MIREASADSVHSDRLGSSDSKKETRSYNGGNGVAYCRVYLTVAASVYDRTAELRRSAIPLGLDGFQGGAEWMRIAIGALRGASPTERVPSHCGPAKYAAATVCALIAVTVLSSLPIWARTVSAITVFYAVEAQMVFLFPLALDGAPTPFRDARRYTQLAGGTLRVMTHVVPIAATMLFGGFVGRGFVRSWCIGCLAICAWYEVLRQSTLE